MRGLLFVHTLNVQGVNVTKSDLDAFLNAQPGVMFDPFLEDLYPRTTEYLVDARLLRNARFTLIVTAAGEALIRATEPEGGQASDGAVVEVVGRLSDPFAYAQLLTRIDDVADAMVIDPYLPPADLAVLLQLGSVRRVLTNDQNAAGLSKADRGQKLRIALGARPGVELRFAPAKGNTLHDRLVLPRLGGEGMLLGASLGGSQLTVATRLSAESTSVLRAHYEVVWRDGTTAKPIGRESPTGRE